MTRHTFCRDCSAPIVLVLIIRSQLVAGDRRNYIPLDEEFDPAGTIPASHALSAGRTTCHPITADWPLAADEWPALTHFATCPKRRPHTTPASLVSTT
jgi:hypothetical protein